FNYILDIFFEDNVCKEDDWVLAKDEDFDGNKNGAFFYKGDDLCVEILGIIKKVEITSYQRMFENTNVMAVRSINDSITNMQKMFQGNKSLILDLSQLETRNVKDMSYMFQKSQATELNLSNFDTS